MDRSIKYQNKSDLVVLVLIKIEYLYKLKSQQIHIIYLNFQDNFSIFL
jgi:hypothetical protein